MQSLETMTPTADILMITHSRPDYTEISLPRLLNSCDEYARVWVWHNGNHAPTLSIVNAHRDHPRFYRLHHSLENEKLTAPTNWLWAHAKGQLLGKVDDDYLVPDGWLQTLSQAHADVPRFGVLSCWLFWHEDYDAELALPKIRTFRGGHQLMQHPWVGGGCYLMKTACVRSSGKLDKGESFAKYCINLAWQGWVNGYYFPLLLGEHLDDPRYQRSLLKDNDAFRRFIPLTASNSGVRTLDEWRDLLKANARWVQSGSRHPGRFFHLRRLLRRWRRCDASGYMPMPTGRASGSNM